MTSLSIWAHRYPKACLCKIAYQYIKMKTVYSLYLEPVADAEMRELIMCLKSSAPGYDNIRSFSLKMSLPFICTPTLLTYISNLSLQEGVFPDEPKVPLLCTVSKIFDKTMYNRLLSFLWWIKNYVFISIWISETSFILYGSDDFKWLDKLFR